MSGSAGSYAPPLRFTDSQYQAAAAHYISSGSYPSWWSTRIQGLNTSGSVASPTTSDIRYQQAVAAAQISQQNYLSGIRQPTTQQASGSANWVVGADPRGQVYYRDTVSGQVIPLENWLFAGSKYTNSVTGSQSYTPPPVPPLPVSATAFTAPTAPTLEEVSNYLTGLLDGSGSSKTLTYAQIAAQMAGQANANNLANISMYNVGSTRVDPRQSMYLSGSPGSGPYRQGSIRGPQVPVYPSTSGSGQLGSQAISTDWIFTDKVFRVTFQPPPPPGVIRTNAPPPVTEKRITTVLGTTLGSFLVTPVFTGAADGTETNVFILDFDSKDVTEAQITTALASLSPVSVVGQSNVNTPITTDEAKSVQKSTDIESIKYSASINDEPRARGPITTLLDLVDRDQQDNDLFPLRTEITWFARDTERRTLPFTPSIQEIALRGPGAFGQRFTFDLGSIVVGDLLLGTALQIQLDHWLDAQTVNMYQAAKLEYPATQRPTAWEYANSLGTCIIQQAELEIDGKTIETIDGDFIHVFSSLFPDYNTQVGVAYDHIGQVSIRRLTDTTRRPQIYPIENGNLNCILPFFFMRTRLKEALPMIAVREGNVKIYITLRPFADCVRQMRGYRDSCDSVPSPNPIEFRLGSSKWTYTAATQSGYWNVPPRYSFTITIGTTTYNWNFIASIQKGEWVTPSPVSTFSIESSYSWKASTSTWSPSPPPINIAYPIGSEWYYWDNVPQAWRSGGNFLGPPVVDLTYGGPVWESKVGDWSVAPPPFKAVQLLVYGAIVDGDFRKKMLRDPFEILHRQVQTFSFDEPLKYSVGKRADSDTIRIQLPLEANHPIEEILWFVRRKGTSRNNEWTNYTSLVETEWGSRSPTPLLQNAILQVNGTVLCDAEEQFYRENAAYAHRGGYAAFSRFIYGYSFAETPGEHQPSGSLNASRVNSLRLVLDVKPPGGDLWEVKVFCIGLNWLRFENGLANPMFED